MNKTPDDPVLVSVSVRIFSKLLTAYPAKFHADYGEPMTQVFRDVARRACREGGPTALITLWGLTSVDWAKTVIEEYAKGGVFMSSEKFVRLSGWALMLGPFLLTVGLFAGSRPDYSPYNAASLTIDRYADLAERPLAIAGLAFISVGLLGILLRYGKKSGRSRWLLGFGAMSGLVGVAGVAMGYADVSGNIAWPMFFLGMVGQFSALTIFGLANLRRRLLRRGNGLLFLAGVWVPGLLIFWAIMQAFLGLPFYVPDAVTFTVLLITILFSGGLGYILQEDPGETSIPAI